MKVQIRPAIYGDKGEVYEAYKVEFVFSWWSGHKSIYTQLYWKMDKASKVITPTDEFGWDIYKGEDNECSCIAYRSGTTIGEVVSAIKSCYGTSVEFVCWRS